MNQVTDAHYSVHVQVPLSLTANIAAPVQPAVSFRQSRTVMSGRILTLSFIRLDINVKDDTCGP